MKKRSAFEIYLRSGRVVAEPLETKFNPNHDERGRFTFAGQGVQAGNGAKVTRTTRSSTNAKRQRQEERSASSAEPKRASVRQGTVSGRGVTTGSTPSTLEAEGAALRAGESRLSTVGRLKIVQFGPGTRLVPVAVAPLEEFSAATAQGSAMFNLEAVITGPQFDLGSGSDTLHGLVVVKGNTFGNSAKDLYYVGMIDGRDGVARLTFGKGDPPSEDVSVGIGGAVPLIFHGSDVAGFDKAWARYAKNPGTGKNIVAYNSKTNTAAIFVQPDGASGYSLDQLRGYIRAAGYDNAVMFDGSGSTSLRYRGKNVVSPTLAREILIPLAIGFQTQRR